MVVHYHLLLSLAELFIYEGPYHNYKSIFTILLMPGPLYLLPNGITRLLEFQRWHLAWIYMVTTFLIKYSPCFIIAGVWMVKTARRALTAGGLNIKTMSYPYRNIYNGTIYTRKDGLYFETGPWWHVTMRFRAIFEADNDIHQVVICFGPLPYLCVYCSAFLSGVSQSSDSVLCNFP